MTKETLRPDEDQNLWNFIASAFFFVLVVLAVWLVHAVRGSYPSSVPAGDVALMALAVLRLTRLMVYDKITRFVREWFVEKEAVTVEGEAHIALRPWGRGVRHTIHELLACPWCIGMWSALVVSTAYFTLPFAWLVIFFLALAGAGSLLQLFANALGWYAENLKLAAEERARE